MRLFLDYRPALRERTGVGEWVHELARGLSALRRAGAAEAADLAVTIWSSSWRDRVDPQAAQELGDARLVDRRVPVRWINRAWYRLDWPAVEWLAPGPFDVVQSTTPALIPARHGLRAMTIYDLDFLHHPDRAWGEMQSDFPRLVQDHARRADLVVTISEYSAAAIARELGTPPDRIVRCRPGVPRWLDGQAIRPPTVSAGHHVLFVGTLEPRKNVTGLLEAYERLVSRWPDAPPLVLAGRHTPAAEPWLARLDDAPLAGRVRATGYVSIPDKLDLYRQAAVVVLPSLDEGFGLPALEAMAMGVPVIASNRGALPEVVGDAGLLVDPNDSVGMSHAIQTVLTEPARWQAMRQQGLDRARQFRWGDSASALLLAYRQALARRAAAPPGAGAA